MICRDLPILLSMLLLTVAATARPLPTPLDPATLADATVFTAAEALIARAAENAGLSFHANPRPLPPRVILPLELGDESRQRPDVIFVWRGDMLPDQLAPAETGTLTRRKRQTNGTWKTTRTLSGPADPLPPDLQRAPRTVGTTLLPELIVETLYHLGTAGDSDATLVLWRSIEEGTDPLGGAITLDAPPPKLAEALQTLTPPFVDHDAWLDVFRAFSP
ncbi:MAG: hypothetical protein PHI93_12410 [Kiritimatiellae bacterium]|nr:hypothetical protein [Kiritimatiellia bacterium]